MTTMNRDAPRWMETISSIAKRGNATRAEVVDALLRKWADDLDDYRVLAARFASGESLSEAEAAVLIEAVALDQRKRLESPAKLDRWGRWNTIVTLARNAADMAPPAPPPNMRIRQGGKVPRPNVHRSPEEPTSWWRRPLAVFWDIFRFVAGRRS